MRVEAIEAFARSDPRIELAAVPRGAALTPPDDAVDRLEFEPSPHAESSSRRRPADDDANHPPPPRRLPSANNKTPPPPPEAADELFTAEQLASLRARLETLF